MHVDVRVGQTRQDGRAFHILFFHLAVRNAFKFVFVPNGNNPPARDEDRRCVRIGRIKSMYVGVVKEFHIKTSS